MAQYAIMKSRFLLIFFICIHLFAWGNPPSKIILNDFLGEESIAKAINTVNDSKPKSTLILVIHSTSGDLPSILELATSIYNAKRLKQVNVIIYINDHAIGPAAILPFLSDSLYASLVSSWGDIPSGAERAFPTNQLKSRVRSLIDRNHPNFSLLTLLSDAMSDPTVQINEEWQRGNSNPEGKQTLVLNQDQMEELKIATALLPLDEFLKKFELVEEKTSVNAPPLAEQKLQNAIPYQKEGSNKIGYLYIGDHETAISESTWLYMKQGLEYYKQNPPQFIVLELDTPGGEVFAAQKISDALKEMDTQFNIPIVTFINNWAISAGAMLAYSTRIITTVKDGSMGAAEPVLQGQSGQLETASEKVNSALRTDFASRARFFDRNPLLAEAMVDKDLILVKRHGQIIRLEREDQMRLSGPEPDEVISSKGKLLTLNADQMLKWGVADLIVPPIKISSKSSEEEKSGKWPADKLLLFHAPFFSEIPNAEIDAYRMDWKTQFFVFLATPLVSSLLFMGFMIGAYLEFNHPGFGLPGIISGACLFLIILSSYSLEIANWLELILVLTGIALLLIELFVLPSFGLLGILGILLLIGGLAGMLIPGIRSIEFETDTQTMNAAGEYVLKRLAWFCGAFIASVAIIGLLAKKLVPSLSKYSPLILSGHEQTGYIASEDPALLPAIGEKGKALTPLKPSGKVIIHDQIYEALSRGDYIEEGESIQVDYLEGSVLFVKRVNA